MGLNNIYPEIEKNIASNYKEGQQKHIIFLNCVNDITQHILLIACIKMILLQQPFQNQMNAQLFYLNHQQHDDTLDLLKQFLPQIEGQLRQQIEPNLKEEYQQKRENQENQIEQQALQQYSKALETLSLQFGDLKREKQQQLISQISALETQVNELNSQKLLAAQEQFMLNNFQTSIMSHPKMKELSRQIQNQIQQCLLDKFDAVRDKRAKELRVRLENREQRERTQLDKAIRTEIYDKSGLEQLQDQVKHFRISLASMKSKYNIKINSINQEIKDINNKCKQTQISNSDLVISQLQQQIESLKTLMTKQQQKQQVDNSYNMNSEQLTRNSTKNNGVLSFNQPFTNYPESQYLQQDIDFDSSDSSQNQSLVYQRQDQSDIPLPPCRNTNVNDLHQRPNDQASNQVSDIYLQLPRQPLLRFDVCKMLREQWQEDDFDRYMQSHKQNKLANSNQPQPTSNFHSLYKEHLDHLNKNSKVKTRKLSDKAKQQILSNLAVQYRKRQQHDFYK